MQLTCKPRAFCCPLCLRRCNHHKLDVLCLQGQYDVLHAKRTSLRARVPRADAGCLSFLQALLQIDPAQRPTARQALEHPWLQHVYHPAAPS